MLLDGDVFSNRFSALMYSHGVTSQMMADYVSLAFSPKVYICRSSVNRWMREKRIPTFIDAAAIGCIFGVSLDWLAGQSCQPYSLGSLSSQQKITAGRNLSLKEVLDIDIDAGCRKNMAARAEAFFIYNYLGLKFEEFLKDEDDTDMKLAFGKFLIGDCELLVMKCVLDEIVSTNRPYYDLRKAVPNESWIAGRVPDPVPPVHDSTGTGGRD